MKKSINVLLIVLLLVLITGGYFFLQKNRNQNELAKMHQNLPESVNKGIDEDLKFKEEMKDTAVNVNDESNVNNAIVKANTAGADAGLKASINNFLIQSQIYFDGNKNYTGFCNDSSNKALLDSVEKYGGPYECKATSTSFTLRSKSLKNPSIYYCTDAKGFYETNGATYKGGISCE